MIQDIYPHKLNNRFDPSKRPDKNSLIFSFSGIDLLINGETLPRIADLKNVTGEDLVFLFTIDDKDFFLYRDVIAPENIPEGFEYINVRTLHGKGFKEKYMAMAIYTGLHLAHWYRNFKFCGRCGKPTRLDDKERALRCDCGNVIYPVIAPAVIVGVTNGDKILVTKYRTGFAHFALVAGFTEIGETLEETVAREVMEETGLKVKNIRYYKSQPWGIVCDLLVGFFCDVDGDDTIKMDESELKVAEWRTREEVELQPDQFSLTNEMMTMFKEGRI